MKIGSLVVFVSLWFPASRLVAQASEQPLPTERALTSKAPKTNAAADELAHRSVRLGLDLDPKSPSAEHPTKADHEALASLQDWAWMDRQLSSGDDSIGSEPEALRSFLRTRSVAIWQVVSVLESGTPEWSPPEFSELPGRFIGLIRLDRLLLAAALVEERGGREVEARRLLDASWSIFRSLARDVDMISALVATAVMRMQVGVLRKMREVPIEWLDRLSGEDPWRRCLDAFENDPRAVAASDPSLSIDARTDSYGNVSLRAHHAAAEALRRVTPCDLVSVSDADIVRPMSEEYRRLNDPGSDSENTARILSELELPGLRKSLVRSGRLAVDAELTLRILELRFARSASRDKQWPAALDDTASRVCPGVAYKYRREGPAMEIAFEGSLPEAEYGLKLPLSFSTRADRRAEPPKPSPTPTPAPSVSGDAPGPD